MAVVGKIRTYSPEEGTMYVSIRPEKITVVDIALRDYWVMETCKATLRRISAMEEAKKMSTPSVDELVKLGYGQALAEGVVKSIETYGEVDLENYRHMVVDALKFLMPEQHAGIDIPELDSEAPEEIDDEAVTDPEAQQTQEDKEKVVLALVEQLDKGGKGAPWDEIVAEAKKSGIDREELDEDLELAPGQGPGLRTGPGQDEGHLSLKPFPNPLFFSVSSSRPRAGPRTATAA